MAKKNDAVYRRSIFTFLDILGFREAVKEKPVADLHRILAVLREAAKPDNWSARTYEMSFMTFSDCTIRAVPVESKANRKNPDGILWYELNDLLHVQYRMLCQGFLLRGSVTIGDICVDGSTVFGPAMVRGYSLESEIAVYPRIIVDPIVIETFKNDDLLVFCPTGLDVKINRRIDRSHIRKLVRRDSDGLYFIDYLRAILSEFDDEDGYIDFLAYHKRLILTHSAAQKPISKISAKLLWVAAYHNSVIREIGKRRFAKRGLNIKDFLISAAEFPLLVTL